MAISDITDLLKQTIGLDPASVGDTAIERAAETRRIACGLPDVEAYSRRVTQSVAELLELIEQVVVPETWFFRHAESFAALNQVVWRDWLPRNAGSPLRLLSVPCSTGEEPYSMAMSLISSGVPPARFRVDAVDISSRALLHAGMGLYGRNSFRGRDLAFRERFFAETPKGHQISDEVRKAVDFRSGNLVAEDFQPGRAIYEIIFCRNLLIYFDVPTQNRAIAALQRLLTPEGCLFVGPAEAGIMLNHGFTPAKLPMAFAFRKAAPAGPVALRKALNRCQPNRPAPPARVVARKGLGLEAKPRPADARRNLPAGAKTSPDLDVAGRLADEGRLDEAASICEDYLKEHQTSARAFFILGVVRGAAGNLEQADDYYRRALYLDPDHYDALMHLAYSQEKRGGLAAARTLRDRARRVKEKIKHG